MATTYDLSKPPHDQGLKDQSYDLIVGLHVLHTVPNMRSCLSTLRSLLVPGGCLLIVELDGTAWVDGTPGSLWHDCIFGSFAEWFGYTDERTHITMPPAVWKDALEQTGFVNINTSVEDGGGLDFLFTAQSSDLPIETSALKYPSLDAPEPLLFRYHCGDEMRLQTCLKGLDQRQSHTVYLLAIEGPDADAALGLIPTLASEFVSWNIRLAIFECEDQCTEKHGWISRLVEVYQNGDSIIFISRDGELRVPRVVPSSTPCNRVAHRQIETSSPTTLTLGDGHLTVRVLSRSKSAASFNGFVGIVLDSRHPDIAEGQIVAGLAKAVDTAVFVVHSSCVSATISTLIDEAHVPYVAGHLLGMTIGSLTLGPSHSSPSGHSRPAMRILIAIADLDVAQSLSSYFRAIPSSIHLITEFQGSGNPQRVDIVLTDSAIISQHPYLRRWLSRTGKLVVWDSMMEQCAAEDPWMIGYALEAGLRFVPTMPNIASAITFTGSELPSNAGLLTRKDFNNPSAISLFDGTKGYILLGGIGGLGIRLALWMCQVLSNIILKFFSFV